MPEPSLRWRALLAAVSVVLLVVGLSWDSRPASARFVVLAVPAVYLLTEIGVFVRGLLRADDRE